MGRFITSLTLSRLRFPIQEHGLNFESQPLQRHEISVMRADVAIIGRVTKSYSLTLDFYGMRLASVDTGLLERSSPSRHCADRYRNLVSEFESSRDLSPCYKFLSNRIASQLSPHFKNLEVSL